MTVHLVGAGPGDPDLLTMRAVSLLSRADVVVHDRLVDDRILASAAPWAELVDVGKRPGSTRNGQDTINEVLADRGARFDTVVRLKGGDPFVFGRGGEEAEYLRARGIAVEVVPGVSSSIAAPAAAGIPVTMRGVASGVTIVTAHQDPEQDRGGLDWNALARTGTTLVVLMGAARARRIAERLIDAGMRPDTPVAVVTSATCADESVERLELASLGLEPVRNPSVLVIGEVAARDVLGELPAVLAARPAVTDPEHPDHQVPLRSTPHQQSQGAPR
jgi:uroporphyrin-III C-methyltransferase